MNPMQSTQEPATQHQPVDWHEVICIPGITAAMFGWGFFVVYPQAEVAIRGGGVTLLWLLSLPHVIAIFNYVLALYALYVMKQTALFLLLGGLLAAYIDWFAYSGGVL